MGFTTANLSLYHTFSKTPVDSNTNSAAAQLGNAINKSGHTVQSNEIWTESIPFFGLAATTTAIHTKFSATAKVNDLVKDSDGKIWQRNSTLPQFDASGALTSKFADLWSEKTKSITSFTKGTDGKYTFTEANGALVDGSYLLNSEGIPTVKYYEKRKLTILTADNNANTNSDKKASRLQIDGKWIDQFIGVTDIYLNGSAAVSYAPVLRKTASDSPMQAGPGKGYMDYCATGLILWESSAAGTEVIDCFEYVGAKLDTALTTISDSVKDIVNTTMQGVVASVGATDKATAAGISVDSSVPTSPKIDITAGTVKTGETKLVSGGSVAAVTDALAARVSALDTASTGRVAVVEGKVSTLEGQVATITSTDATKTGSIAKALADAKSYVDTTALTPATGSIAKYVENYVASNAKVSVNGQSATTITVKGTETSSADLVKVVVTEDKTTTDKIALTLTATADVATVTDGVANSDSKLVTAGGAKDIAEKAISTAITETDGAIKSAITGAISGATLADGQKIATTTDTSKLVTVEDVTTYVSENAKVTLTQGTGITVTPSGQASTSFTVAVDDTIATKKSVEDLSALVTGVSQTVAGIQTELSTGTIATGISEAKAAAKAAQDTADAKVASVTGGNGLVSVSGDKNVIITVSDTIATKTDAANAASSAITTSLAGNTAGTIGKAIADVKATADTAVKTVSKSGSSTLLTVTQTGTAVTVGLSDAVATKTDITNEVNKLTAANGAITTLSGKVSAIEKSLADGGTIHELIDTAKATADAKVADVTVDGTSIVSGNAGAKSAALTTTKGVAITASADSTSTALATEASVAKALASITSVGVSYEVLANGQTHTSVATPVKGRIYLEKDTTAADGSYIEWMWTGSEWEKIGSTKTDHSTYASTITVNGSTKSVANSTVDLGAFASSVTAGNGIASGSVSATGALSLTLTTASTTTAGIAQLTDAYTSTDATKAATGKSIAAAIATLDASKSVNGITVTQVDGKITEVSETLITASVPAGTTKVEGNIAYVGSTKHVIAPEKFETAAQMPATLTSWVADLSNLTVGNNMFKGCTGLTTFVGDLSSLISGLGMFNGCTLDAESLEILAENLPTVTSGSIDIGASTNATEEVITTINGKGWIVSSNGTVL